MNGVVVLSRVNLSVERGTLAAIVGPPGAGKSTLLRCMLGTQAPRAGEVRVLGGPTAQARRRVGYMPQDELVDWRFPLSVSDVVMMGRYRRLGLIRRPGPRDRALVMACLSEVRLDRFAERRIGELSAGKRRLALLARALVNEPEVLLLDEPLQGLDARTEADLFRLLERLRQRGMVVVVATRDLACVPDRFQHAVLLNGQVIAQGRPAEVLTQAHLQATYGSHLVSMRVDAGQFAVDAGPHQR